MSELFGIQEFREKDKRIPIIDIFTGFWTLVVFLIMIRISRIFIIREDPPVNSQEILQDELHREINKYEESGEVKQLRKNNMESTVVVSVNKMDEKRRIRKSNLRHDKEKRIHTAVEKKINDIKISIKKQGKI